MHTIKYFSFLLLCFLLSIVLSACGSKGDLYHDEEPEKVQQTTVEEPQKNNQKTKKKPQ